MTNGVVSTLEHRFIGCLLGLAVGDAFGAPFEAQRAEALRARFASKEQLLSHHQEEMWYTDDTQMAIGVAETLIEHGKIIEAELCRAFVTNYDASRGYGRGARMVLEAMEEGRDYRQIAERHFPGGSFGNGAAMRVAPVGLYFRDDRRRLWEQAGASALPTHRHPLGIEGAQLLALAVSLCTQMDRFDRAAFFAELLAASESEAYRAKLQEAANAKTTDDLARLGNGIAAIESAPTAIAGFALTPESYEETITNMIFLGGDVDTLAAMAGALSGAYLGIDRLPTRLVNLLESTPKGGAYLRELGRRLYVSYERSIGTKQFT